MLSLEKLMTTDSIQNDNNRALTMHHCQKYLKLVVLPYLIICVHVRTRTGIGVDLGGTASTPDLFRAL